MVFQLSLAVYHLSLFFWIGLSAGQISQVIVGDEQRQYLLVVGQDVDDVQLAQRLAQANEIVLSWNCWKLCEQYMFEVEIMREDEAVKVGGCSHPLHILKRPFYCTGQCSGGGQIWLDQTNDHWNSVLEGGGGYAPRKIEQNNKVGKINDKKGKWHR